MSELLGWFPFLNRRVSARRLFVAFALAENGGFPRGLSFSLAGDLLILVP